MSPIPVTILTGFLGAGKTTLLNHILRGDHGLRVAVLVNDFGAVNIDAQLVVGVPDTNTVNLSNGCICCTIRDDLLDSVLALIVREDPPQYIIVETSGVSDPVAVVLTFMLPDLREHLVVDSILTVIDSEQVLDLPEENIELAQIQVAAADMVVLNKVDLVSESELEVVRAWVGNILPKARVFETAYAQIPLELALGVGRYDPAQTAHEAMDIHIHAAEDEHARHEAAMPDHDHEHDHSTVFETWYFDSDAAFDMTALREIVKDLPSSIYRAKGWVYLADAPERRGVLQVVGRRIRLTLGEPWNGQPPRSQIVVIGAHGRVDAQALRKRFDSAFAQNVHATEAQPFPAGLMVEWLR